MEARARIAWNLRRIRVDQAISQESLAVDANVDRSYISGLERRQFNPSVDVLDRLAIALSVDVSEFLVKPGDGAATPIPLSSGRRTKSR